MKIITMCAAAGIALAGLGAVAGAGAHGRPPSDYQDDRRPGGPGMQGDRGGPGDRDRGPGDMRGDRGPGGPGGPGYRGHRRCRTVIRHHHRVRRCY